MTANALLLAIILAGSPCDPAPSASSLDRLLQVLGLTASARGTGEDHHSGDLYSVAAADGPRKRLTEDRELRSPLFSDEDHLVAIQGDDVVRIDLGGNLREKPKWLVRVPGAIRLATVADDDNLLVALIEEDAERYPAVVCLRQRTVTPLSEVDDDRRWSTVVGRLRFAERRYGNVLLRSEENGEGGRDIYRYEIDEEGEETGRKTRLTRCGPDICSQGALSPDGRLVVFVRTKG